MKLSVTLLNVKRLTVIALGMLAVGFVLPTGASACPYLSKAEAKREASEYFPKAIGRWVRNGGATPPVERDYRWIGGATRLGRNLFVFDFSARYYDADYWKYDVEGQLRVREIRRGHYFVRGANVDVFESSNE